MRKLQTYLSPEAEAVLPGLERMWRLERPQGTLSQDLSRLIVTEAEKHREWLANIEEAAGPAEIVKRSAGRPRKETA